MNIGSFFKFYCILVIEDDQEGFSLMKNVSKAQTLEEEQVLGRRNLWWLFGCRGHKCSSKTPSTSLQMQLNQPLLSDSCGVWTPSRGGLSPELWNPSVLCVPLSLNQVNATSSPNSACEQRQGLSLQQVTATASTSLQVRFSSHLPTRHRASGMAEEGICLRCSSA